MSKSAVRVVSGDETYEDILMDDGEIVQKVLNGASLRTFMIPDSSMPSNYPEHIETYDLPHVIINGEYFWAKSETAHLRYTIGKQDWNSAAFCYTNIGSIFCGYVPAIHGASLMSRLRYKTHCWNIKENYNLIWDSETSLSTEPVKKAIEACLKFRVAMLDAEDVWNIHPVDLPMYYTEAGTFELKTVMDEYPFFFRYPGETKKLLADHHDFFANKPDDNVTLSAEALFFYTFYALKSDGTYYNFFDIARNTTQRYKRLKVFAGHSGGKRV